jgi:hypothetical protein
MQLEFQYYKVGDCFIVEQTNQDLPYYIERMVPKDELVDDRIYRIKPHLIGFHRFDVSEADLSRLKRITQDEVDKMIAERIAKTAKAIMNGEKYIFHHTDYGYVI